MALWGQSARISNLASIEETASQSLPAARSPRQKQVRLTVEKVNQLAQAYLEGDSMETLAASFNINVTTVRKHLRSRGVERGGYRKVHGVQLVKAMELYAAGLSLRSVAAELGVSRNAVRSGLLAGGVTMRSHGRREVKRSEHLFICTAFV